MNAVGRALQVRSGEGLTTVLVTALAFVAMGSETIGESGINALFFATVGADRLPEMYLLQAPIVFAAMVLLAVLLPRTSRRRAYLAIPLILAVVLTIERALLAPAPSWLYPVLWVTVSVALLLQAVFLWGVAGLVTDTRQAKRLFPIFAGGAILGAVVGGLLTRPLAAAIGAENLLLIWAAGLVGATFLVRAIAPPEDAGGGRRRAKARRQSGLGQLAAGLRYLAGSRLLRAMATASVLLSVLFFLLYLPYAQAAAAQFPDAEELAGFFGLFWAAVTGVALLVSLVATNRILGRFGVATVVVALPVLYVAAFGVVAWRSTFVVLVAIRFLMGVWMQAIAMPAWESLTNVTPAERRDQVRAFLSGGPAQVGTAIAGVIGLVGGSLTISQLAVTGLVLAAITVVVAWNIRRSYTSALLAAIRAGRPSVFGDAVPGAPIVPTDADAIALLLGAANDADPQVRRLAVWMLPADDPAAQAELTRRMEDDDVHVRLTAAAALLDGPMRGRALPLVEQAVHDDDPTVRGHAMQAMTGAPPEDVIRLVRPALADPDPDIRAAAMRVLATVGDDAVIDVAARSLASAHGVESLAAVEALERFGAAAVAPTLDVLRQDPLAEAAVEALSRLDAGAADSDAVRQYVAARAAEAEAGASEPAVDTGEAWASLLHAAVRARARSHARAAFLGAAALGTDRSAVRTAVDSLGSAETEQVADGLEVLELEVTPILGKQTRRLLTLWEAQGPPAGGTATLDWIEPLRADPDPLIRALARRAAPDEAAGEEEPVRTQATSPLERTMALRSVPLFVELEPADLHAVAEVAEDRAFAPGEHLADEGDMADDLHLITSGTVRIEHGDPPHEFARRGEGDVVGEMSLVSRAPRVASVVADTEVRTIALGRLQFESIIRDRPAIAIAVMRVLADRAMESTRAHEDAAAHHD